MADRNARRCHRCYEHEGKVTFSPGNRHCDSCEEEKAMKATSRAAQGFADHHQRILAMRPKKGDPVTRAARKKGLDPKIVREITKAQRAVCEFKSVRDGTVFRGETPEDVCYRLLGDPEDAESRTKANALMCSYLSASMDAAIWLGWYVPHGKR